MWFTIVFLCCFSSLRSLFGSAHLVNSPPQSKCFFKKVKVVRKLTFVLSVCPPETQLSAVDSLIESMMLVEEGDNEEKKDIFKVHHIPNPTFQRLFQVLQSSLC